MQPDSFENDKRAELAIPPELSEADERLLKTLRGADIRNVIRNHDAVLKWIDFLPIHYIIILFTVLYIVSVLLKTDFVLIGFITIPISVVPVVISFRMATKVHTEVFFYKIEGPARSSYSSNIKNALMFPKLRLWIKAEYTLCWFWIILLAFNSLGKY